MNCFSSSSLFVSVYMFSDDDVGGGCSGGCWWLRWLWCKVRVVVVLREVVWGGKDDDEEAWIMDKCMMKAQFTFSGNVMFIIYYIWLFQPKETVMISETAGLWSPADVAKKILSDSLVSIKVYELSKIALHT